MKILESIVSKNKKRHLYLVSDDSQRFFNIVHSSHTLVIDKEGNVDWDGSYFQYPHMEDFEKVKGLYESWKKHGDFK